LALAQFWLRETFIATVVENGLDYAAELVGLSKSAMMHLIAPLTCPVSSDHG